MSLKTSSNTAQVKIDVHSSTPARPTPNEVQGAGWASAPHIRAPLPGPVAARLIAADQALSSPSHTRDYPLVVKRAQGCVVEDVDGNLFIDFAAGIAVCATGHCHPQVVEAIQRQAEELIHICGSDFYYPIMVRLMEKLAEVTPGSFPKRFLLTNSGAECTEAAFKLARFHTGRKYAIAFFGAFHGRTMGALSLTCSKSRQQQEFGPLVPMVAHAPYGETDFINDVLFKHQMHPHEVAAIFVEPVLGEGGYIIPPAAFLQKLRAICDEHGILLICDEIQSGMGRTGQMYACEHFGVVPDILLTAKGIASGMPIGAVVARADIMDWPPGAQGSTYGGNPVSCAAAVATIELLQGGLLNHAREMGPVLAEQLQGLAGRHACVRQPRSLGLMGAVDIVDASNGTLSPALRQKVLHESFHRGLILLPCGLASIRFCPPLIIDRATLERGLGILDFAVRAVLA